MSEENLSVLVFSATQRIRAYRAADKSADPNEEQLEFLNSVGQDEEVLYYPIADALLSSLSEDQKAALALLLSAPDSCLLETQFVQKFGALPNLTIP